jgi:ribosomal protein S3AE
MFVRTVGTAQTALRRVAVRLTLEHRSSSFNDSRRFHSTSDNIVEIKTDDSRLAGIIVLVCAGSVVRSAGAHAIHKVVFVLVVTKGVKVGWCFADNVGLLLNGDFLEGLP